MSIWNRIKDALHKETITSLPTDTIAKQSDANVKKRMGQLQNNQNAFKIENANAQSWNPETHPNGRGDSFLVADYSYDGNTKELNVTYRDGFNCTYDNITEEEAKAFNKADSKGRWAKANLFNRAYH